MKRTTLVVAAMLTLVTAACGSTTEAASSNTATSATAGSPSTTSVGSDGVVHYEGLGRDHTTGNVEYPESPPVGGNHDPSWQNCGVYDEPVRNENAVHSLEHGAVWLAYNPSLSAADVEILRAFALNQTHVLVSPYVGLADGEAVVATAWGTQLRLDSVTDPRLAEFVATYQEGSQTPELGVTCSGAVGSPIA
ncbi:MAG: DUF3105 domain-containing protein [Ilumatobacteraceae bacterium]